VVVIAAAAARTAAGEAVEEQVERQMGVLGIRLEQATFEDAARRLGPAEVRWNGEEAAAGVSGVCYIGADGTALAFTAGELNGGELIDNFQLVARPDLAAFPEGEGAPDPARRPRCAPLPALTRATATAGGLRLGMSADEVRRVAGEPEEEDADYLLYSTTTVRELGRAGAAVTTYRVLEVELAGGVAVAIRALRCSAR
jgi:hypothetical protein